jgi:hypothetical protein
LQTFRAKIEELMTPESEEYISRDGRMRAEGRGDPSAQTQKQAVRFVITGISGACGVVCDNDEITHVGGKYLFLSKEVSSKLNVTFCGSVFRSFVSELCYRKVQAFVSLLLLSVSRL